MAINWYRERSYLAATHSTQCTVYFCWYFALRPSSTVSTYRGRKEKREEGEKEGGI